MCMTIQSCGGWWWCGDVFRDIQEIELRKGKLIEYSEGSQE